MSDLYERFWAKVRKSDGCWEWTARTRVTGYGRIAVGAPSKKQSLAHRVSWEFAFGPVPDGLWVLHRCDNRLCVRIDHLFIGTPLDNVADMMSKGRWNADTEWPRGEARVQHKWTEVDVRAIRDRVARGERRKAVARDYGMSITNLNAIVTRKLWSHVV